MRHTSSCMLADYEIPKHWNLTRLSPIICLTSILRFFFVNLVIEASSSLGTIESLEVHLRRILERVFLITRYVDAQSESSSSFSSLVVTSSRDRGLSSCSSSSEVTTVRLDTRLILLLAGEEGSSDSPCDEYSSIASVRRLFLPSPLVE